MGCSVQQAGEAIRLPGIPAGRTAGQGRPRQWQGSMANRRLAGRTCATARPRCDSMLLDTTCGTASVHVSVQAAHMGAGIQHADTAHRRRTQHTLSAPSHTRGWLAPAGSKHHSPPRSATHHWHSTTARGAPPPPHIQDVGTGGVEVCQLLPAGRRRRRRTPRRRGGGGWGGGGDQAVIVPLIGHQVPHVEHALEGSAGWWGMGTGGVAGRVVGGWRVERAAGAQDSRRPANRHAAANQHTPRRTLVVWVLPVPGGPWISTKGSSGWPPPPSAESGAPRWQAAICVCGCRCVGVVGVSSVGGAVGKLTRARPCLPANGTGPSAERHLQRQQRGGGGTGARRRCQAGTAVPVPPTSIASSCVSSYRCRR